VHKVRGHIKENGKDIDGDRKQYNGRVALKPMYTQEANKVGGKCAGREIVRDSRSTRGEEKKKKKKRKGAGR